MSQSLFGTNGSVYDQSAVIDPTTYQLNSTAVAEVGLPRYTTTYAISQLCYNLSTGAAVTAVLLWNWKELKAAFGDMKFLRGNSAQTVVDPHYEAMKKYAEVPQWWYIATFVVSLAVGIGCSYASPNGHALMPAWSIILFTIISALLAVVLGFITATTGFQISIKYAIQVIAAFIHPGQPIPVMYANLYGNSTSFQVLYMLQDLKLGQYTKLPPRWTFAAQMAGSVVGSIFNYTMMISIIDANSDILRNPTGTRIWSGWIIQSYNSASVALGALGRELFEIGRPSGYWIIPFSLVIGLSLPLPFWLVWRYSPKDSRLAKAMEFINMPIISLYIGYLPYSVNGQWWSCLVIGLASQWWARTRRPGWFKKYNYLLSAGLDGGSQVILFILSFAVFGASGNAVDFPTWWGNSATLSVDRCMSTSVNN